MIANMSLFNRQLITQDLIDDLLNKAQQSSRLRINHNFHPSLDDNPHRFLNVMVKGTYVTPHKHANPPKAESFLVISGSVLFYIFDEEGHVSEIQRLGDISSGADSLGIDLSPGIWHSLVVDSDYAVIYEVKPGPYDPEEDKQFASWAPREGEQGCEEYLRKLQHVAATMNPD